MRSFTLLFLCLFAFSLSAQETDSAVSSVSDSTIIEESVDSSAVAESDSTESSDSTAVDSADTSIEVSDTVAEDTLSQIEDTVSNDVDSSVSDTAAESVEESLVDSTESFTPVTVVEKTVEKSEKSNGTLPIILVVAAIIIAVVLLLLLIQTIIRNRDRGNFLTRTRISIMDREVQLVCRYIEQHYTEAELTPDSVCEALSTGKSFVENLFHKELDMTIEGFINHVRIHHAVNKINEGYEGEAEPLMVECGYRELVKFEHDFFTVTGVQLSSLLNRYN